MPRTAGQELLSRERILCAAVAYADANGADKLSMRQLATQLDAGVMSIYHYFSSKDELLDAMVDWVAAKIHRPETGCAWRPAITEIALSANQAFTQHVWVNAIWSKRKLGPHKLAYLESVLRVLREDGFSVSLACDAYHAITVHIEGFALHSAGFPVKAEDVQSVASAFLESLADPAEIPYFVEHVRHHLDQASCEGQFEMMLNMILDGFESRLSQP